MSNFTPMADYETEFEGDTVTMKLRRLKRADQQKLIPYMGEVDVETGTMRMTFRDQNDMSQMMLGLLPSYVTNFSGLTDAAGSPVALETAIEEVYFQNLVGGILVELLRISNVEAEEGKGSGESPAESLEA